MPFQFGAAEILLLAAIVAVPAAICWTLLPNRSWLPRAGVVSPPENLLGHGGHEAGREDDGA